MKPLTPQELSIGNLLNYDTGEGIELTVIDWQDLKWLQEEPDFFNNHFSPAPLTPEILDGFGAIVRDGFCFLNEFYLRHIPSKEVYEVSLLMAKGTWKQFDLKHAHTLQNFIHAISGVELVYKQNKT